MADESLVDRLDRTIDGLLARRQNLVTDFVT